MKAVGLMRLGPARHLAGWAHVGADTILRGWVSDRAHRDRRLGVNIFIDGVCIGRTQALRPDATLAELEEGDGAYAFAFAIPAEYRDGRPHRFKVRAPAAGFTLRTRDANFSIDATNAVPELSEGEVGFRRVRGWLQGGQYAPNLQLDVWADGALAFPRVKTVWTGRRRGLASEFEVRLPPAALALRASRNVVLSAPGMLEAGFSGVTAPSLRLEFEARLEEESLLRLRISSSCPPLDTQFSIELRATESDERLLRAPVKFNDGLAELHLPKALASRPFTVGLLIEGSQSAALTAPTISASKSHSVERKDGRQRANLIDNPGFAGRASGRVDALVGRTEIAEGWWANNRRPAGSLYATLLDRPEAPEGSAMALAASEVPSRCLLEVRLDPRVETMREGMLTFQVAVAEAAQHLLPEGSRPVPDLVCIHRIGIVRRRRFLTDEGIESVDDRAAHLGQRITAGPHSRTVRLPFLLRPFDPVGSEEGVEHLLIFEFRQPFAIILSDAVLLAASTAADAPALQLEDEYVAAQARTIPALEDWLSPHVWRADEVPSERAALRGARKWRWSASRGSVEVVVCVHDAIDETLACLEALPRTTEIPHTVRVVDDGSSVEHVDVLSAFLADKPWATLSLDPVNRGYTRAAQNAVQASEADRVVLLNSDTIPGQGWLEGLFEAMDVDSETAFVGPVSNAGSFQSVPELYDDQGKWKVNELPHNISVDEMADRVADVSLRAFPEVPLLNGFCLLMRREAFLSLGGFDVDRFPLGYGEENDLLLRARGAGMRLRVADHAYVFHHKSASFGPARAAALSAEAARMLRDLHPEVDMAELTRTYRDLPSLVALRQALRASYPPILGDISAPPLYA